MEKYSSITQDRFNKGVINKLKKKKKKKHSRLHNMFFTHVYPKPCRQVDMTRTNSSRRKGRLSSHGFATALATSTSSVEDLTLPLRKAETPPLRSMSVHSGRGGGDRERFVLRWRMVLVFVARSKA